MSDLISRQAAIDALGNAHFKNYGNAILVIKDLPSADPKNGEWIDETFKPWGLVHHPFKCNLCGEHAEFASPYCPNCGARMDEDD